MKHVSTLYLYPYAWCNLPGIIGRRRRAFDPLPLGRDDTRHDTSVLSNITRDVWFWLLGPGPSVVSLLPLLTSTR